MNYLYARLQLANWNKDFVMCSDVEAGNFTTLLHSILLNVGNSVFKMTKSLWKKSLIIANGVWTIHVNLTLLQLYFPKKIQALLHYCPLYDVK
jgi:hypothetical protein